MGGIEGVVQVSDRAASMVRKGYLWVFSNEIDMKSVPQTHGQWCTFASKSGPVGTGYVNRHSLITGRIVARGEDVDLENLLHTRLTESIMRRGPRAATLPSRLVFSESDLLPGLIVDWYPPVAVIQTNTAGIDTVLPLVEKLVPEIIGNVLQVEVGALVIRGDSSVRRLEGVASFTKVSKGTESDVRNGLVHEHGLSIAANFLSGQKTGYFLDQRENRRYLETFVKENHTRRVLDLCCYSGGWGLHALAGGAAHVTFVDQSADALELVKRSLNASDFAPSKADLIHQDVFSFLSEATEPFDLVIADPPAFVKSKRQLPQAVKAYRKLNRLAWKRLSPGGTLFTCSCSYHLDETAFRDMVNGAIARETGMGQIFFRGAQGEDHPVLVSMPETSYLKCMGVRKLS